MEALLRAGAMVSIGGSPALQEATMEMNVDCVSLLLQWNADPNAVDVDGNTALHKARRC